MVTPNIVVKSLDTEIIDNKKQKAETINLKLISNFEKIELSVDEMKSSFKEVREHIIKLCSKK